MKYRNLITNILYVLIIASLVGFLLLGLEVWDLGTFTVAASSIFLAVAVLSVIMIEVVLPVIANRDMLKSTKYVVRVVIKSILLVASAVVLFLHKPFGVIDMTVALVIFIAAYFIQFFINLEPGASRKKAREEIEETEEDEESETAETGSDEEASQKSEEISED